MRKSKGLIGILFLFIVTPLIGKVAEQQTKWKGKIDIENGIKHIKNPRDPLFGEIVFDLEENASIGNDKDDSYAFFKAIKLIVDKDENIFVLDSSNLRIQKYNRDGHYLLTIGRQGQGPGEFQFLRGAFIDSKNYLYINQIRSLSIFDKNGKFNGTIPLSAQIGPFGITPERNIISSTITYTPKESTNDVVIINSEGKIQKRIASFKNQKLPVLGNIPIGGGNPFPSVLFFSPIDENLAVFGYSSEYKLYLINGLGEIISIIEKEDPGESITKNEKDSAINREIDFLKKRGLHTSKKDIEDIYPFPPHKPFFYWMMTDDQGNIYVEKIREAENKKKEVYFDLFNPEGYYLYRVTMKDGIIPEMIVNRSVYATKENPEKGYYEIKRYRIRNWAQIKVLEKGTDIGHISMYDDIVR